MSAIRFRSATQPALLVLFVLAAACVLAAPSSPARAAYGTLSTGGWGAALSLPSVADVSYAIDLAAGSVETRIALEFAEPLGREFAGAQNDAGVLNAAGSSSRVPLEWEPPDGEMIALRCALPLEPLRSSGGAGDLQLMLIDPATGEEQELIVPIQLDAGLLLPAVKFTGIDPDEIDVADPTQPLVLDLIGEGLTEEILPYIEVSVAVVNADGRQGPDVCGPCGISLGSARALRLQSDVPAGTWEDAAIIAIQIVNLGNNENWDFQVRVNQPTVRGGASSGKVKESAKLFDSSKLGTVNGGLELAVGENIAITDGTIEVALSAAGGLLTEGMEFDSVEVLVDPAAAKQFPSLTFEVDEVEVGKGRGNLHQIALACHSAADSQPRSWAMFAGFPASWDPASVKPGTTIPLILAFEHQGAESRVPVRVPLTIGDEILPPVLRTFTVDAAPPVVTFDAAAGRIMEEEGIFYFELTGENLTKIDVGDIILSIGGEDCDDSDLSFAKIDQAVASLNARIDSQRLLQMLLNSGNFDPTARGPRQTVSLDSSLTLGGSKLSTPASIMVDVSGPPAILIGLLLPAVQKVRAAETSELPFDLEFQGEGLSPEFLGGVTVADVSIGGVSLPASSFVFSPPDSSGKGQLLLRTGGAGPAENTGFWLACCNGQHIPEVTVELAMVLPDGSSQTAEATIEFEWPQAAIRSATANCPEELVLDETGAGAALCELVLEVENMTKEDLEACTVEVSSPGAPVLEWTFEKGWPTLSEPVTGSLASARARVHAVHHGGELPNAARSDEVELNFTITGPDGSSVNASSNIRVRLTELETVLKNLGLLSVSALTQETGGTVDVSLSLEGENLPTGEEAQKQWLPASFRFEIGNLQGRVAKIDSFTIKQSTATQTDFDFTLSDLDLPQGYDRATPLLAQCVCIPRIGQEVVVDFEIPVEIEGTPKTPSLARGDCTASVGDLDGDGRPDVVVVAHVSGENLEGLAQDDFEVSLELDGVINPDPDFDMVFEGPAELLFNFAPQPLEPAQGTGGGGGTGKVVFSLRDSTADPVEVDFSFAKEYDKSTPKLAEAVCKGRVADLDGDGWPEVEVTAAVSGQGMGKVSMQDFHFTCVIDGVEAEAVGDPTLEPGEAEITLKRTFVLPHVLESSGRIAADGSFSFDTTIFIIYVPDGQEVSDEITLDGQVTKKMMGAPKIGEATARAVVVDLDGDGWPEVETTAQVSGQGMGKVSMQDFHFTCQIDGVEAEAVGDPQITPGDTELELKRTFVLPHVLERDGRIAADGGFTFDTTLFITYLPDGQEVSADTIVEGIVKQYDKATPKLAEAVCKGRVADLDGDGWPEVEMIATVSGQGMGKVSMQDFHFTCKIGGVEAEAVGDTQITPGDTELELKRTFVLPHVLERDGGIAADGSFSFDTTIFITYLPDGQEVSADTIVEGVVKQYDKSTPKLAEAVCRATVADLDGDGWPEVAATAGVSGQGMGKVSMQDIHFTCVIGGLEAEAAGETQVEPGDTEMTLKRTFVLPHVLERDGRIAADGTWTFDTTMFITYLPDGQQVSGDTTVSVDPKLIVPVVMDKGLRLADVECTMQVADFNGDGRPDIVIAGRVTGEPAGEGAELTLDDLDFTLALGDGSVVPTDQLSLQAMGSGGGTLDFGLVYSDPPMLAELVAHPGGEDDSYPPGDVRRVFVVPHVLEVSGSLSVDAREGNENRHYGHVDCPIALSIPASTAKSSPKLAEAVCKGRVADVDGDGRLDLAFECTVGGEDCDDLDPAMLMVDADCDGQDLALQGFVVNSHTNGFDLSCFAPLSDTLLEAMYGHGTGGTFRVALASDPTQSVEAPYQLAQLDKELDKMAPRLASVACSPSVGDFDGDGILDLALALELTGENLDQLAGGDLGAEVSFADGSVVPAENLQIEFSSGSPTAATARVISDGWQMLGLLDTNKDGKVIAIIRSGVATGAGATASAAFSLAGLDKEFDKMGPRLADVDITVGDVDGDGAPDLACVVKGEVCDDANSDNIFVTCVLDGQPVACDHEVSNARSSGFDLAVFGFDPQPIAAAAARSGGGGVELELVVAVAHAAGGGGGAGSEVRKTFVLPHVLEVSGSISSLNVVGVTPLEDPSTLEFQLELDVFGKGLEQYAAGRQKKWLPANFKIKLGDLPCGKISKVEALVLKQGVAPEQGNSTLTGKVSVSDLSVMKNYDKSTPLLMRLFYTDEDGDVFTDFQLPVGEEVWRLIESSDPGTTGSPVAFRGGVNVAAGDVNGDGRADVMLNFTLEGELIAVRKENIELRTLLGDGSVVPAADMLIEVIGESDTTLDMSATIFSPAALADATPRTGGEDDSYPEGDIRRTFVVPHVLEVSGDLRASLLDAAGLPLIAEAPFSLSIVPTKIEIPNLVSGGVRVATGDVNGDGMPDVITSLEVQVQGENLASLQPQDLQVFVNFGGGEEEVNLQGFVVNAHSSAFDLSVFGFEPQPLAASARKAGGGQQEYLKIEFSDLLVSSYSIAPGSPGSELQLPLDLASFDYLDPDDDGDTVPTVDEEFAAAVDSFHYTDVVLDRAFRAGNSLQLNFHTGGLNVLMGDGSVRSISEVSPSAIAERFGPGPLTFGVDAQVEGKSLNFETQIDPSSASLSFDLLLPYVVGENPDLDLRLSSGGFLECFLTQYSIVSPRDAASGMPTGKRQHKPITITKEWDKATPLLMQALVSNESLNELPSGEVELNFTVTGEGQNLDLMTSSFVITDPETGQTFPGTPQVLQSSDGAVQILIGLLLPAVQKVREAAARGGQPTRYNFFEAWPCRWECVTLGGEILPMEELSLNFSQGASSGGDRPTESLSLNFTKIEFRNYPDGSTGLEGEFEFTGDPALLALLDGTSAEAESRKGWDGKVKGRVEFDQVDQAARKRPGRVKYGDITLKRGQMSLDVTLSLILPYIEQDKQRGDLQAQLNWQQAGLDGARLDEQVTVEVGSPGGDPVPTESLSLNFTKIEFRNYPDGSTGLEGEFEFTGDPALLALLDGTSAEAESRKGWDGKVKGRVEFDQVDQAARKRPGRVKYGDIVLKQGWVSYDADLYFILPYIEQDTLRAADQGAFELWQQAGLDGARLTRQVTIVQDMATAGGDVVPTDQVSLNFSKIEWSIADARIALSEDGAAFAARVTINDFDFRGLQPIFELLLPDGETLPVPVNDMQITGGTTEILIGLLLPAVQKVREAAARGEAYRLGLRWAAPPEMPTDGTYMEWKMEDVLISSYQTGGSSGDVVPTDQISLNFTKIEFRYEEGKIVPTADGGDYLSARCLYPDAEPRGQAPTFEVVFPDGTSMPCPVEDMQITGGMVQILIGMLLPAVQKVREAAARSSAVEWQMQASIIGEDGSRVTRFDPVMLDLSAYQTGGSGGGSVPTESLSLNFTKIEFKYSPQKSEASGKTTGELELGWECAGLSEDELKGASWTLSSGGSGGEVSYLKYELKNVMVSSYSSGDNTPIIRGSALFSDLSIDVIVLPEDGSTVDVPLVVCLLPAVQKATPTCESITCKMGRVELAAAAGGHSQGGTVGPVLSISFPDVAKTPSPGGPIPIPYPNLEQGIAVQFEIDNMPPETAVDSAWETCTGGALNIEIADSSTGADKFQTTSPGHKYVDTLTLRGPLTAGRKDMLQWYQDMAGVHQGELFIKLTDGTELSAPLALEFVSPASAGGGGNDAPTESLSLNFTKIIWSPKSNLRASLEQPLSGDLELELEVVGDPQLLDLLGGAELELTSRKGWDGTIKGAIEFGGTEPAARKRPGRVKYSNIVLKRGLVEPGSETSLDIETGLLLPAVSEARLGGSKELYQWWQAAAKGKNIRKNITINLRRDASGDLQGFSSIDNAPEEKERGITINTSHVEYESARLVDRAEPVLLIAGLEFDVEFVGSGTPGEEIFPDKYSVSFGDGSVFPAEFTPSDPAGTARKAMGRMKCSDVTLERGMGPVSPTGNGIIAILIGLLADGTEVSTEVFIPLDEATAAQWKEFSPAEEQLKGKPRNMADAGAGPDNGSPAASSDHNSSRSNKSSAAAPDPAGGGAGDDLLVGGTTTFDEAAAGDAAVEGVVPQTPGTYVFELVVADNTGLSSGHVSFGPEDRSALMNFTAEFVDGRYLLRAGVPLRFDSTTNAYVDDFSFAEAVNNNPLFSDSGMGGVNPLFENNKREAGGGAADGTVFLILNEGSFADLRCALVDTGDGALQLAVSLSEGDFPAEQVMFNPKEVGLDKSVPWQKSKSSQAASDAAPAMVELALDLQISDPGAEYRVKVKFPWILDGTRSQDDGVERTFNWEQVSGPLAASRGFYYLPEVGDEVLVSFQGGDIDRPIILGSIWNGSDSPPPGAVAIESGQLPAVQIELAEAPTDDLEIFVIPVVMADGSLAIVFSTSESTSVDGIERMGTISNVSKARHDTAKNSIGNIR